MEFFSKLLYRAGEEAQMSCEECCKKKQQERAEVELEINWQNILVLLLLLMFVIRFVWAALKFLVNTMKYLQYKIAFMDDDYYEDEDIIYYPKSPQTVEKRLRRRKY